MNRKIMKMASLALVLILAVGMAGSALAKTLDFKYTTEGGHFFAFTPENRDLFENFKNVLPGDTLTQEITLQNTYDSPVRIWMRADPVDEEFKDFLNQMTLTVTANGRTVFEETAGEQDGLAGTQKNPYGVLLGTFGYKGTVELVATLHVPIEMGNEYMNEMGIVPWTFTAEDAKVYDTPETGDDFTMWVWVGVAAVLMAGIVVLVTKQRKQRTEN